MKQIDGPRRINIKIK